MYAFGTRIASIYKCLIFVDFIIAKFDTFISNSKSIQQFLYVELTAMEEDLKKMSSEHPVRTCNDIKLEKPFASSGFFTVDPNLGSSKDSIKTYCDFDTIEVPRSGNVGCESTHLLDR